MRKRAEIEQEGAEGRNAFALLLEVMLDVREVFLDLHTSILAPHYPGEVVIPPGAPARTDIIQIGEASQNENTSGDQQGTSYKSGVNDN